MGRFHVLIHAPLYAALRRLPLEARARFRRHVERLSAGNWGGGTRVKKLRGTRKPVFEARQDGGDRLLFTVARTAARDATGTLSPHLQLWDLVEHDRVSGHARRLNTSAEAEFLDFDEIESELIGEPPPHPGATFAEVATVEDGTEAGVVEFMLAPDSQELGAREELVGAVRWYVVPESLVMDEVRWRELTTDGGDELELKLTAEQYAVVRATGPVLLSGSAGSGKTTIAVHRLAAASTGHAAGRALYVTYSGWLLDHARRLFGDLVACRGERPAVGPDFLTVHGLYRGIVAGGGPPAPDRVVDFPEFARWYAGAFRRQDAALAWEEIRSIVKGASLDPRRPLLGRDDYEALGRKRAPLFVAERPRLYQVARRWQEHLEAGRLIDEIDLCRLALHRVPAAGLYDHILCDEAQDLAEIQVELLLRLLRGRSLANLFLAGDPQQVINPSGFRWAEVRSRARDRLRALGRPGPDLHVLTRNFRSVGGLVDLANEVLALKRDRVGRSDGDQAEEPVVAGGVPVLVVGAEAALVEAVRGFGPRCAVVTGSADLRTALQATLDTARIFTVAEAKGLEFDAVVLWGVVAADPDPWRRLLEGAIDLHEDAAAKRALHHLYVAVTRARQNLAVYEPADAPPLWRAGRFAARLDPEPPASLSRLFVRSATPDEWLREGEYFRERARHRQAAECFRRAGDVQLEAESLAQHHEAAGEFAQAAARWVALDQPARAARAFEHAADHAAAAREWSRAGDEAAARRCRVRAAEADRRWSEAAEAWESLEAWDDATRCWANAGARPRQLRCLALAAERDGRHAAAAPRWVELEDWGRAAAAWRAAGREIEARAAEARAHEAAGRWEDAARAWDDAGDARRALRCRAESAERGGCWDVAAGCWEELGDLSAAVRAWQRAGNAEAARACAVRRDLADGRFARAAEAFEDAGDFAAAAEAWDRAARAHQSPSAPRPLPLPAAARHVWCEGAKAARLARTDAGGGVVARRGGTGNRRPAARRVSQRPEAALRALVCAARAAEDAGRFVDAMRAWRALREDEQVLRCRVFGLERGGHVGEAAHVLQAKRRYRAAAERWQRLGALDAVARCEALEDERRDRLEEAAARWDSLGERGNAARCRGTLQFRQGEYESAARAYEEAGSVEMVVMSRLMAAKLRGDYDGARRLLEEADLKGLAASSLGPRDRFMAEARALAASHRHARTGVRADDDRPAEASGAETTEPAPPAAATTAEPAIPAAVDAVLAVVRRQPGLTCEDIAALARLSAGQVKPILALLTARGFLIKTGRTRGTRYSPRGTDAEPRPAPAGSGPVPRRVRTDA